MCDSVPSKSVTNCLNNQKKTIYLTIAHSKSCAWGFNCLYNECFEHKLYETKYF